MPQSVGAVGGPQVEEWAQAPVQALQHPQLQALCLQGRKNRRRAPARQENAAQPAAGWARRRGRHSTTQRGHCQAPCCWHPGARAWGVVTGPPPCGLSSTVSMWDSCFWYCTRSDTLLQGAWGAGQQGASSRREGWRGAPVPAPAVSHGGASVQRPGCPLERPRAEASSESKAGALTRPGRGRWRRPPAGRGCSHCARAA